MYMLQIIGHDIKVESADAENGKFITTVARTVMGKNTVIDSKVAESEADAVADFNAMVAARLQPLQSRVNNARMEKGCRYTIVTMTDFGMPVALNFTYEDVSYKAYAQYDDAACIYCIPKGARNLRTLQLRNQSFAIYDGWRVLSDDMVYDIERRPDGVVTKAGKYPGFDERYIVDICGVWADYRSMFQNVKPDFAPKKPEPMPDPDPVEFKPIEIAPGLTLMMDAEHGLFVDMTPETFEELYAPRNGESLPAEEILSRALRRATVACMAHANDEDGGTCNFDSPTLDYESCGMARDDAERVIKAVGLSCYDWEKQLVITGPFGGQANRRTNMARAFYESMTEDGVAAGMYYQMD